MRYLSLFSGMEAAHLAWAPLGWECVAVAEIDPAPCALLRHRLPHVPNLGDVTAINDDQIAALGGIDVVIGGSPCQDLSVAGRRAGLAGLRSSLFHQQMRIFNAARHLCGARFLVWENVPGAFSSNQGRDFAVVVGAMAGCEIPVPPGGWGCEGVALGDNGLVEWSVLDAQWFGVAQRRRRVFSILDAGNWEDRPPILLEPESLRGDSAPRRGAGEAVAGTLTRSAGERGAEDAERGQLIPQVAGTLSANPKAAGSATQQDAEADLLLPVAFGCKDSDPVRSISQDVSPTLRAMGHANSHANAGGQVAVHAGLQVRRLTPVECERLQGVPDGWTAVPNAKGRPMADGPRYRMLGNSFAVPVILWIGQQIDQAARYTA